MLEGLEAGAVLLLLALEELDAAVLGRVLCLALCAAVEWVPEDTLADGVERPPIWEIRTITPIATTASAASANARPLGGVLSARGGRRSARVERSGVVAAVRLVRAVAPTGTGHRPRCGLWHGAARWPP